MLGHCLSNTDIRRNNGSNWVQLQNKVTWHSNITNSFNTMWIPNATKSPCCLDTDGLLVQDISLKSANVHPKKVASPRP